MKDNHGLGRATRTMIGCLLACASAAALAAPQTWDLTGITFDDGTTALGSFTYDADTDTLSNWSITTQSGQMQGVAFGGYTYNTTSSSQYGTTIGSGGLWTNGNEELFLLGNNGSYVELDFAAPLTDVGGTASLLLLSNTTTGPVSLETDGNNDTRYVTAGVVTAVPEPSSLAMTGMGLIALIAMRRRKQS